MRIGIVGLGLAGATTAAVLAKRGFDITVFEQAQAIREVGAGVSLWANTIRLLMRIGMTQTIERIGVRMNEPPLYNRVGEQISTVSTLDRGGVRGHTFHRAELLDALSAMLPRERLRLAKRCVGATQSDDRVRLDFADGSTEEFDLVLGADGIRSAVAAAIVPAAPPKFANLVAYRGLVPNAAHLAQNRMAVWTDRTRYFIVFPVSRERLLNFVGVVPTGGSHEESWFAQASQQELAAEFEGWDVRLQQIVATVRETFRWGLYYRDPLPRIAHGRIALVGDAAHPMTPHAGMGFGQAIEDGFALGVLLAGCQPADIPARLALYQELRLPRATFIQDVTRRNAQFFHGDYPLKPGETRPDGLYPMAELIEYDVELEAEKKLRGGNGT